MFSYLHQIWRTEDLRRRILISLGILILYRFVAHVPIPGSDPFALQQFFENRGETGVLGIFATLTGGAVDNFSLALLGLAPYINASIIIQLCTVIFPKLEAISKEGVQGQQTLNRYMRWLSAPLAFLQSYGFLLILEQSGIQIVDTSFPGVLLPMLFVTTGSLLLMWMGEMITEKGIGNGISLIIFAGIVADIPTTISSLFLAGGNKLGPFYLFTIITVATLIAVVIFTDAHRSIPITYASQGAGRGVQGNLPVRLNQAGMIPILFAISLLTFPTIIAQFMTTSPRFQGVATFINTYFNPQTPGTPYIVIYFLLVVAFTYFYVSVTFKPQDIAEQIQKRGGFIPGIRPGPQTARILEQTSNRMNLWGGAFLGVVAIIPLVFTKFSTLSSADLILSGSGLIILVGVVMELIRQINAQMLAHDYEKLV